MEVFLELQRSNKRATAVLFFFFLVSLHGGRDRSGFARFTVPGTVAGALRLLITWLITVLDRILSGVIVVSLS